MGSLAKDEMVTSTTLLSAAPVQSDEQETRANRLYQVVCVRAPASYVSELLDAMSLKSALLLVVDDCHLYSKVPECPPGAALLVKAAGSKGELPLCAAAMVPPEVGLVQQNDSPPLVAAYIVLPEVYTPLTVLLPKPLVVVLFV